jgi:hypothetical protein
MPISLMVQEVTNSLSLPTLEAGYVQDFPNTEDWEVSSHGSGLQSQSSR